MQGTGVLLKIPAVQEALSLHGCSETRCIMVEGNRGGHHQLAPCSRCYDIGQVDKKGGAIQCEQDMNSLLSPERARLHLKSLLHVRIQGLQTGARIHAKPLHVLNRPWPYKVVPASVHERQIGYPRNYSIPYFAGSKNTYTHIYIYTHRGIYLFSEKIQRHMNKQRNRHLHIYIYI